VNTTVSSPAEVPAQETQPQAAGEGNLAGGSGGSAAEAAGKANGVPVLPVAQTAQEAAATDALLPALREFHLTGRLADPAQRGVEGVLPALMAAFREPDKIRHDYPLFLYPNADPEREELCLPLYEFLASLVDEFAPGADQARILRDNLGRLEHIVRVAVQEHPRAQDALPLLTEAATSLRQKLALKGENADNFSGDLDKLLGRVPGGGEIVGLSGEATVYLLLHAAGAAERGRRSKFVAELGTLTRELEEMLAADQAKDESARKPEELQKRLGKSILPLVDPSALAKILGETRGAPQLSAERRSRIGKALEVMKNFAAQLESMPLVTVVHDAEPSEELAGQPGLRLVRSGKPCSAAGDQFEHAAAEMVGVFRAVRVARLELMSQYEPERHGPWLSELDWRSVHADELELIPPVVALVAADQLTNEGLGPVSRLIRSGMPVLVLVTTQPAENPDPVDEDDPASGVRFEIGQFGMSHREALVHQSAAARPAHLLEGLSRSLASHRAAIHVVDPGLDAAGDLPSIGAWLYSGAAIESRAHQLFFYDPDAGASWIRRLQFGGNPNPEEDWSSSELGYKTEDGDIETMSLAFTFADFALLDPEFVKHYWALPATVDHADLVPLADYLGLSGEQAARRIPFVWGVDADGLLRKLAVTRALCFACGDRLSYWQSLQELAGVRSELVEIAAREAREEADARAAEAREELLAEHAAELATVRSEASDVAMESLASVLMGADLGSLTAGMPAGAAPAAAPAAPAAEEAAAAEAPVEAAAPEPAAAEEMGFDDPWIDTPLCTSCNDCCNINALVFVYDENKQARIGDAKAGTFADMVLAAEKCPARCIHPGKPLDPSEPNLDDLVKRAAPFN